MVFNHSVSVLKCQDVWLLICHGCIRNVTINLQYILKQKGGGGGGGYL